MDETSILEKIIEENGSCCWAKPTICAVCPLGLSIKDDTGKYMSCVEALNIDGLSEAEADAKYKRAAEEKLMDIKIKGVIEAE